MRFDLYTSEDRANEARAYYRQHEAGRYQFWVVMGSYCTTILFAFIPIYLFPDFVFAKKLPVQDILFISVLWPLGVGGDDGIIQPGRLYAILGLTFIGMYIWAYVSAKVVAFFQGLLIGILIGTLAWFATWVILWMLVVPQGVQNILPWFISITFGLFVLALGFAGAFLPSYR